MLLVAVSACGVTKHLPEGRYMLTGNKVVTDKDAPKDERIKFESRQSEFSKKTVAEYLAAKTFHDGASLGAPPAIPTTPPVILSRRRRILPCSLQKILRSAQNNRHKGCAAPLRAGPAITYSNRAVA